jgi:6-phosphogluconolactonase (cycloisomerase 2 family)
LLTRNGPAHTVAATIIAIASVLVPFRAGAATEPAPSAVQGHRTLYVTNGSTSDVSTFVIGRTGTPTALGGPVRTGEEPRGIVFSPNGKRAYVVNSLADQVSAHAVGRDGRPAMPIGHARTGAFPFGIAISPDGRTVYTTNADDNSVSAFAVQTDGGLRRLGEPIPTREDGPRGVAVTPDGRFLYTANGRPGDLDRDSVTTFAIRHDGTLVPHGEPTQIGAAGDGIVISPDGRFLYVDCEWSAEVYGFRIGHDGGLTPVPRSPVPADGFPVGAAVTPDGRHLYVASGGSPVDPDEAVLTHAFTIGADGALTPTPGSPFVSGSGPVGVTPTPDGRYLYVSNVGSDDISAFEIRANGDLRELKGSPYSSGGDRPLFQSAAVRPNQGPVASFSTQAGKAGEMTRFDGSESSDPDGHTVRYDWDFGDGVVKQDVGPTPVHTYRRQGTFKVTLVVTDNENCSTRIIFTGQTAFCNGSAAARALRDVIVR